MLHPAGAPEDRFVTVDGLKIRYIERGDGHPVIFLHGASLGSSADVFIRNLPAFADAGLRVIAYDQPGFGLSDKPEDHSLGFRRRNLLAFCDALGMKTFALVAHSQAGNMAVQIALDHPGRCTHVGILGTGSLLPPMTDAADGRDAAAQARLDRRMATEEPTLDDTRKLLEAVLFHRNLITPEELALRHGRSLGENFRAFVARSQGRKTDRTSSETVPLWRRLTELKMPLRMIYGRDDRANAFERATRLKEEHPELDIHIVPDCKHLVPWDAEHHVARLLIPFLNA